MRAVSRGGRAAERERCVCLAIDTGEYLKAPGRFRDRFELNDETTTTGSLGNARPGDAGRDDQVVVVRSVPPIATLVP